MSARIIPLIVCGGSGSRLWPVSRDDRLKQFLRLVGEHSSFQETLRRVADPSLFGPPLVVTHRDCEVRAREQIAMLGMAAEMLLEPERRNSGPAILAGVLRVAETHGAEAMVLALAADHHVKDVESFCDSCRDGLAAAEAGAIVTFGIVPDHPATAYGYIEPGERRHGRAYEVRRFIEKPDVEQAELHMRAGLLWNSGNFLFRAATLHNEYEAFDAATVHAVALAVQKGGLVAGAFHLDAAAFAQARSRSIDCAVMEKTARAMIVRAGFDWADIGSWPSLHRVLAREESVQGGLRSETVGPRGFVTTSGAGPEYWIVAEGIATAGGVDLRANDFIRIAAGETRWIENKGESELRLVVAAADES